VSLTTEFWEVEGARGWDVRLVDVVAAVTVLAIEGAFFTGFSSTSEVFRFELARGAIFKKSDEFWRER